MVERNQYRFSITIHTEELAVVNCLRALSQFSQKTENNRIPWRGTKDKDWQRDGKKVTFRFNKRDYRDGFIAVIEQVLRPNLCNVTTTRDDDPPPQ